MQRCYIAPLQRRLKPTMVATPLLALWRHEDARAAVVDFLSTRTIAVLPIVAKPLREAQSRLIHTAIKRRGKTLPNPPTTRACLDTLIVGETHYFCEKWERGLEEWRWINTVSYTHLTLPTIRLV